MDINVTPAVICETYRHSIRISIGIDKRYDAVGRVQKYVTSVIF